MVDWQADLPKFLVELVEDELREVGVPLINQVSICRLQVDKSI
jgi:hypothetical protein